VPLWADDFTCSFPLGCLSGSKNASMMNCTFTLIVDKDLPSRFFIELEEILIHTYTFLIENKEVFYFSSILILFIVFLIQHKKPVQKELLNGQSLEDDDFKCNCRSCQNDKPCMMCGEMCLYLLCDMCQLKVIKEQKKADRAEATDDEDDDPTYEPESEPESDHELPLRILPRSLRSLKQP